MKLTYFFLLIIILVLFKQYKDNRRDLLLFLPPLFFSLIIYFGYLHSRLIEVGLNIEVKYNKAFYSEESFNALSFFVCNSILAFNLGYLCFKNKTSNKIQFDIILSPQNQKKLVILFVALFLLDFVLCIGDIDGPSNFLISKHFRGTHFGINQFDRSTHFYINIILVVRALLGILLYMFDIFILFFCDKTKHILAFAHLVYSFLFLVYSQSQSIIVVFFILSFYLLLQKKRIGAVSLLIIGIFLSLSFRFFRTEYNQLGFLMGIYCLKNISSIENFDEVLSFNPLNCYPQSTFVFEEINHIFSSYTDSFIQLIYLHLPFPGLSVNHELGINTLSAYLGLDYGVPTPALTHIYSGFKNFGILYCFFIGLISKYILIKSDFIFRCFALIFFLYSFLNMDHSNIRAFWRIYSFALYGFVIYHLFFEKKVSFIQHKIVLGEDSVTTVKDSEVDLPKEKQTV